MKRAIVRMRQASTSEARSLGVPPAYRDVRIAIDPTSDLLATALTPQGKTYYKYSTAFIERQTAEKWLRVRKLARKLEAIELRVVKDASEGRPEAVTARLIMLTGLRNGGDPQGACESYGASSLLLRHVTEEVDGLHLRFPGKKAVAQHVIVSDQIVRDWYHRRQAAGASRLFDHDALATLHYFKSIGASKAHDFRTWRATSLAKQLVRELEPPRGAKALKKFKKAVATAVAEVLGNTPSVALKSYIDPAIWPKE